MMEDLKRRLVTSLPRELLLDLIDMATARALAAHELIRDHTDLQGRSARGLEGQARFRLMEKGFQDACEQHGGVALAGGLIPGTELRFFQPFIRFGGEKLGIVLGLASMPARKEIPTKNQSRLAGVTMNYNITPRLNLDGRDPKPGDVFVAFLVARDPARAGKIDELAIGVIDSKYESYLLYEPIETLMADYVADATPPGPDGGPPDDGAPKNLVKLKRTPKTYKPPENPDDAEKGDKSV